MFWFPPELTPRDQAAAAALAALAVILVLAGAAAGHFLFG